MRCCGRFVGIVGAAALGAALVASPARACDARAEPPAGAVPGASEWHEPASLEDAASMIRKRLKDIRACLDSAAVAAVHSDAWDVARLARAAPVLAAQGAAGLPPGGAAAVARSANELARSADALHALADAENIAEARRRFDELAEKFAAFEALVPGRYACPMRCEGGKVYRLPERCPVCEMKLKRITRDEYSVTVAPREGTLEAGRTSTLVFRITDPAGALVERLDVVHEQVLHLLMVSEDLSWYAHEHPVRQADGTLELEWAFPSPGRYTLYNDFTPPRMGMQVVPVTLDVPGQTRAPIPLEADASRTKTVDGLNVTLTIPEPIVTGATTKLRYLLMDGNTPVKDLQPYLGALGHLIIIKDDRTQFVHSHPKGKSHHAAGGAGGGPVVLFEAYFKVPGRYKAWAQFQRAGKGITVPFVFDVKPGKVHAEEETTPE